MINIICTLFQNNFLERSSERRSDWENFVKKMIEFLRTDKQTKQITDHRTKLVDLTQEIKDKITGKEDFLLLFLFLFFY